MFCRAIAIAMTLQFGSGTSLVTNTDDCTQGCDDDDCGGNCSPFCTDCICCAHVSPLATISFEAFSVPTAQMKELPNTAYLQNETNNPDPQEIFQIPKSVAQVI
jgi:hypothetical protein